MNDLVKKLREETGAGVMDCKRALQEAQDDFGKAVQIIKEKGLEKAQKKSDRETGAGLLRAYIHNDRIGVLLELRCETDFVARTEGFNDLARLVLLHIAAMAPTSVEELLIQPFVQDVSKTVLDVVKGVVAQVGENIQIARFSRFEL